MASVSVPPSLYDWSGGTEAFQRLFKRFYDRVQFDPMLGPLFASMNQAHAQHVASFVAEVFGGPKGYTSAGGSHAGMISHHLERRLTHEQRKAWVALLIDTADEIGLPDDPEFRASFVGYLEWGSRLALINSQPDAAAPDPDISMPSWNWASPGGPYQS